MKVLVFTDLHYYGGSQAYCISKKKLVQFAEPMLDEFKRISKEEKVDFVINLGDIIQDTNNKALDLDCLKYIFGRLQEFSCPVYSVLGNHDLKMMNSIDEVEPLIKQNPATFSMNCDGFHLVFLSPEVRPELGLLRGGIYKTQNLSEETLKWLEKDLEQNKLPTLVFTHFSLAEDPTIEDECMFLKNRDAVKDILLKSCQLKAVFVGHQHTPKFTQENGIPHYIIGSPTASLVEDGIPIGTYLMIETKGNDLIITDKVVRL
jgi:alkaline phosphatase